MKGLFKVVLTLGVAGLLAGPALAQRPGGGGGRFGGPGMLLQNEGVQKELKMDKEQVTRAREALQKVQEKHRDDFAQLRDLSPEERREKLQELNRKVSEEARAALKEILKPEQAKRLRQIELQQQGPMAFNDPEVQSTLKLTDEQKEKVKTVGQEMQSQMRELFQGGGQGGDFEKAREKMTSLRKEATEKVLGLLNDDQKRSWKELTGEPFEVKFEFRRPGRGRDRDRDRDR